MRRRMENVSAGLEPTSIDGGEAAAQEHVGELAVECGDGLPLSHAPLGLGEVDVGVPEAGGDDAVVAGHLRGAGGNLDVLAHCGDKAVADQHCSVFDGWIRGRNVDLAC